MTWPGSSLDDRTVHVRAADDVGALVRARRRALGVTQQEVADLAAVSARFLHALEHGKPTVQLAQTLAVLDVLGLELRAGPASAR